MQVASDEARATYPHACSGYVSRLIKCVCLALVWLISRRGGRILLTEDQCLIEDQYFTEGHHKVTEDQYLTENQYRPNQGAAPQGYHCCYGDTKTPQRTKDILELNLHAPSATPNSRYLCVSHSVHRQKSVSSRRLQGDCAAF